MINPSFFSSAKPFPVLARCLPALVLFLAIFGGVNPAQAQFEAQFERVYQNWKSAMVTKNFAMWDQYTASYRKAETQNMVISRKDKWPEAMFAVPFQLPEITALTYLETIEVGNTAHVIYFGKVDFGLLEGEIPENILMLCFIREGRDWKFDRTRFFNLNGEPGIRHQAKTRDLDFLKYPQFRPTGEVPETPELLPMPDYVGELWIASVGYETTVTLGDHHMSQVGNNVITDVVHGGLSKAGKNIRIEVKPLELPDDVKPHLEIGIYALRPGKPAARVWHYKPDLEELPEVHEGKVWANAVTIPGG